MKKVVYTAIIKDGADKDLRVYEPKIRTKGWDYVIFTDDKSLISKYWRIIYVDRDMSLNPRKQARKYKILNEKYLPDYDVSIWVDSRFKINCDLNDLIEKYLPKDYNIAMMNSPKRQCVFKELNYCKIHTQCPEEDLTKQYEKYKKEGVPSNVGLMRTGLIIRRHGVPSQKDFMSKWFKEIIEQSERDTPSFSYVRWKNPLKLNIMPTKKVYSLFR